MANTQVLRALVVDDDTVTRQMEKLMLLRIGFEVTEAKNGKDAVEAFCDGNEFNLVLMDKEMPMMDGIEATRTLKKKGVETTIVAITSDEHAREAFVEAGADAYFVKPFTPAKLDDIMKTFNFLN